MIGDQKKWNLLFMFYKGNALHCNRHVRQTVWTAEQRFNNWIQNAVMFHERRESVARTFNDRIITLLHTSI